MPRPSACGFPDATNAGVPPGTHLTVVSGPVTLSTPGTTYSGYEVHGDIIVAANNVTIANVRVISGGWRPMDLVQKHVSGTRIHDVEINMHGQEEGVALGFDNFVATRVWIHNGLDCAYAGHNVVITNSFCDLPRLSSGSSAHADGFQSGGGSNFVFSHNTIRNPNGQTSAILMSTNTGAIDNVVIDDNLMSGRVLRDRRGRGGDPHALHQQRRREFPRRLRHRAGRVRFECHRVTGRRVGCAVTWRTVRRHGVVYRYSGAIAVRLVSRSVARYGVRLRVWSAADAAPSPSSAADRSDACGEPGGAYVQPPRRSTVRSC